MVIVGTVCFILLVLISYCVAIGQDIFLCYLLLEAESILFSITVCFFHWIFIIWFIVILISVLLYHWDTVYRFLACRRYN